MRSCSPTALPSPRQADNFFFSFKPKKKKTHRNKAVFLFWQFERPISFALVSCEGCQLVHPATMSDL
jgi:hypothetical protein